MEARILLFYPFWCFGAVGLKRGDGHLDICNKNNSEQFSPTKIFFTKVTPKLSATYGHAELDVIDGKKSYPHS